MSRDSRPRQYGDAAKLDDRDRISGDRRERDSRSHRRDDYANTSSRHDRSRSPERHRDDDSHSYRRPRADDGRRDRRDSPPRGSGRSFRGSRDDDRKRHGEDGYGQSSSTKLPPRANSLPDPKTKPIMMKLGSVGAPAATKPFSLGATSSSQPLPPKSKPAVAKVFGNDSDSEEEEMPPEAKMRMKNVGRFTPTSAGPNSFGKTKAGFVDSNTLFQRKLDEEAKKLAGK